jgi:hypothetical protein
MRPDAPQTDTMALRVRTTRPAVFDKLFIRLEQPLVPGTRYVVTFFGLRSLSGIVGSPRSGAIRIDAPPAADTTGAVRDTARTAPDTTRARPDTVPP